MSRIHDPYGELSVGELFGNKGLKPHHRGADPYQVKRTKEQKRADKQRYIEQNGRPKSRMNEYADPEYTMDPEEYETTSQRRGRTPQQQPEILYAEPEEYGGENTSGYTQEEQAIIAADPYFKRHMESRRNKRLEAQAQAQVYERPRSSHSQSHAQEQPSGFVLPSERLALQFESLVRNESETTIAEIFMKFCDNHVDPFKGPGLTKYRFSDLLVAFGLPPNGLLHDEIFARYSNADRVYLRDILKEDSRPPFSAAMRGGGSRPASSHQYNQRPNSSHQRPPSSHQQQEYLAAYEQQQQQQQRSMLPPPSRSSSQNRMRVQKPGSRSGSRSSSRSKSRNSSSGTNFQARQANRPARAFY